LVMDCLPEYVAKPTLLACSSLEEATQLASVNRMFHLASKELDVLQWWAHVQLERVEACLAERFWLMDDYLEWVKQHKHEDVTTRWSSGRHVDIGEEKLEILMLLISRCRATQSLAYISAMFKDGVFHLVALLGQWCAVLEEHLSSALLDWAQATDQHLWEAEDLENFRAWHEETQFRQPLLATWKRNLDSFSDERDHSQIVESWGKARGRWLCLFIEEHLVSFGAAEWGIPELVESMVSRNADGMDDNFRLGRFYEQACKWGWAVSFKEWVSAAGCDDIFEDSDGESDSSSLFSLPMIDGLQWGRPCSSAIKLVRHFALILKHWHGVVYAPCDSCNDASLNATQAQTGTGCFSVHLEDDPTIPADRDDTYLQTVPTLLHIVASSRTWYLDPWFWIEHQSAALAFAPEAPPLVIKVLCIRKAPRTPPHVLPCVMARFRREAFKGTVIQQEVVDTGIAMTRGIMAIMAMQTARTIRGIYASTNVGAT